MNTIIHSNGSKWLGEKPDSLEILEQRLKEYPLDKTFEKYGNFVHWRKNVGYFWGNFATISHVFDIETTDIKIFRRIKRLIRKNQQRSDYQHR